METRRIVIANAFSLNMLDLKRAERFCIGPVSLPWLFTDFEDEVPVISVVGHADTAAVLSDLLGFEVACNRVTYKMQEDDLLIVGQYIGPRLAEGTTKLPEGGRVEWFEVRYDPD